MSTKIIRTSTTGKPDISVLYPFDLYQKRAKRGGVSIPEFFLDLISILT
ncbi:hypothetical protein KSD_14500 [Ktedonobacter sp. SOSP1-85]|uniref:Uncharacterized protein n=1 Tax=Ktedonobacter robiniae TaxID=2778365 RepID=A0ABQ3UPG9_9CHLR|nr:hypothetical protein KSB_31390 [Ktedonobacter robiniae]GHO67062.1 hypothetical protein KSC_059540 [Ktedonobacter sp. SOSP1-52]GHO73679.1 hypothetical protein KSD_14500 [Ktedonobacter sp. SOSP1-85]